MANVLGFAGLGVCVFAFICALLALAVPHWAFLDSDVVEVTGGIWESCVTIKASDTKTCSDPLEGSTDDDLKRDLRAVRACVILGFILLLVAIVPVVLLLFVMKDKKILGFIAGAVAIVGGLFMMIAFAVYEGKIYEDTTDHGAAFAFCIISWIAGWIAGALILVAAIKGGGE